LTTPGYCFYDNNIDTAYQAKWGALYNWYAVNTGKLAPAGWWVPRTDWDTLMNYLITNGYNYDGSTSSNEVAKSLAAQTDWASSTSAGVPGNNLIANNRTGFAMLPAGYRSGQGDFSYSQTFFGYWWNGDEDSYFNAWNSCFSYSLYIAQRFYDVKTAGFSIRLVRNAN
jgi:uncharacterized protein (TIGR02145 family)